MHYTFLLLNLKFFITIKEEYKMEEESEKQEYNKQGKFIIA